MSFGPSTPLAVIDQQFKVFDDGPGAEPFQLKAGMAANGLEMTPAVPQPDAPKVETPRNDVAAGLIISAVKPMTPGR